MAARPQSKVASRAAGCNYEPAEDPVRTQTLLEWVSSNLQPFETISLRSAARGHDTEEWKYKSPPTEKGGGGGAQSSSVNYRILSHDQHLAFTVNAGWNTWAGIGVAKSAGGQAGGGGGGWGWGADRPAGKVMTSIHKVTAILDFVNSAELSRHFHLWFIVFWCGLVSSTPPSIFPVITAFSSWGTSASDCAKIILSLFWRSSLFFFFSWSNCWKCELTGARPVQTQRNDLVCIDYQDRTL